MDFSGIRAKIIDPCGEWDATKQYTAKDFVTYQGSSYMAVYDVTTPGTNPATDTDHWQLMASKGDKGDPPTFAVSSITGGKRITITSGDEVTVVDLYDGIVSPSGEYPLMTVGDITPDVDELIEALNKFAMQPTGGYADIMTGEAEFLIIKGSLDENLQSFKADKFISTKMNLVDSTQYITIGDKKAYIFPVVKGEQGEYGTSNKNNGYIILTTGTVNGVYFKTTKPTADSYGSACGSYQSHDNTYYTPSSDGWMTVIMDGDEVPAVHIVWNNEKDDEAGEFGNVEKSLTMPHSWGMAMLQGPEYSVYDENNYKTGKMYPRIELINLGNISSLSWDATTETVDENTTYIYKYTLPTAAATKMKPGGLWVSNYDGLVVDHENGKLVITSTTITTASDLVTALNGKLFYYELNTVTPVTISNASTIKANTVDNFGLSYFMLSGELVTVEAYVTEAFHQTGKGQLFDGLARQGLIEEIVAHALCTLNARQKGMDYMLRNNLINLLVACAKDRPREMANLLSLIERHGSGSPITNSVLPLFYGEWYNDDTNKKVYKAFGYTASDWVLMN